MTEEAQAKQKIRLSVDANIGRLTPLTVRLASDEMTSTAVGESVSCCTFQRGAGVSQSAAPSPVPKLFGNTADFSAELEIK
jgi:hypothetical protein